jgi:hypothetical protein
MYRLICYIVSIFLCVELSAQKKFVDADSTNIQENRGSLVINNDSLTDPVLNDAWDRITESRIFEIGKVPLTLFVLGGLSFTVEDYVYNVRNYHIPTFRYHYDDYLQYAPGVIAFGMKGFGVKGYSSWERMLTSTGTSAAITFLSVTALKNITKKERPDGSARNSFPSGHTATAFLTATWLHKEYGLTRSPLYSVAGFSLATITGISRQLNNKHWFSDVLFGAGIGYLSAELGYWIGDLIFKDKGIETPYVKRNFVDPKEVNPSFINLSMGYVLLSNKIDISEELMFESTGGYNVGIEGAWFVNPYIGFGGKISSNTIDYNFDDDKYYRHFPKNRNLIEDIQEDFSSVNAVSIGGYCSYPLSERISVGTKLLGGIAFSSSSRLTFKMKSTLDFPEGKEIDYLKADTDSNWGLETGISMNFMLERNLGVRLFVDYLYSKVKIKFEKNNDLNIGNVGFEVPPYENEGLNKLNTHNLIMGVSVNAFLF